MKNIFNLNKIAQVNQTPKLSIQQKLQIIERIKDANQKVKSVNGQFQSWIKKQKVPGYQSDLEYFARLLDQASRDLDNIYYRSRPLANLISKGK